jgi:hypothetical protein
MAPETGGRGRLIFLAKEERAGHRMIDNNSRRRAFVTVIQGRTPRACDASIARLWQRHESSTRRLQARTSGELRDTLQQEAADFQQTVMSYVEENSYIADETGMWKDSVALRSRIDPDTTDNGGLYVHSEKVIDLRKVAT